MKYDRQVMIKTIHWRRICPFLLIAYITLAIPTVHDIWRTNREVHLDIYGRIMLSFLILGVACPLFSINTFALFCRITNALQRKSFLEFIFPTYCSWPDLHEICAPQQKEFSNGLGALLHTSLFCASILLTAVLPIFYFLDLSSWLFL